MKTRIIFFFLFIACLFLFYLLSLFVKQERLTRVNFDTTVRLQDNIPRRFDGLFEDMAFLVSPGMSIIIGIALTGLAFFDIRTKRIHVAALIIPLAFVGLLAAEVFGKSRVESPAPPFFMIKNPTTVFPRYHVQEQYSYPSGHAARSMFFVGIASLIVFRSIRRRSIAFVFLICFLCLSLFISVGKVYLGRHWLSDILGGWILAWAFLSLCAVALSKKITDVLQR